EGQRFKSSPRNHIKTIPQSPAHQAGLLRVLGPKKRRPDNATKYPAGPTAIPDPAAASAQAAIPARQASRWSASGIDPGGAALLHFLIANIDEVRLQKM
ncbi:hypothetical protein, partial [Afifella marina]|uniref:hypothetical protein n=1 Tax=Afifella marina TaxID=1080 RepID=UPI001AECDD0F